MFQKIRNSFFSVYYLFNTMYSISFVENSRVKKEIKPVYDKYLKFEKSKDVLSNLKWSLLLSKILPFAISKNYANLTGVKLKKKEKTILILISAMIIPYDSLIDDLKLSKKKIDALISNPKKYTPIHTYEKITLDLYLKLTNNLSDKHKKKYIQLIKKIHKVQLDSIEQHSVNISEKRIHELTLLKGGYTQLLLCYLINPNMSKKEENILINLGGWIQYIDDFEDKEKDEKDGIYTFATHPKTKDDAEKYIEKFREKTFKEFMTLPYKNHKKKLFLFRYYLFSLGTRLILSLYYKKTSLFKSFNNLVEKIINYKIDE